MKKLFIGIMGLSLMLLAAVAFARPGGMGQGAGLSAEQQKFFDATTDLRKEMHDKRFQLMELYRSSADQAKIDAIHGEIDTLMTKIRAKAQEAGIASGQDLQNSDCFAGQGKGRGCNGNQQCGKQAGRGRGMMMGRFAM